MTRPIPYTQEAHDALLKASFGATPVEKTSLDAAEKQLRQAIELSPDYARAHGELAYTLTTMLASGWYGEEKAQAFRSEAAKLADRAIELDPNDYMSYWNKAHLLVNSGELSTFDEGIACFEKALELFNTRTDPMERKPGLLVEFGEALVYGGQVDRGIEMIRKAMRAPDWYRWSLSFSLYCKEKYDEAIAVLDDMTFGQDDKQFIYSTLLVRGAAEAQRGNDKAAKAAVEAFFKLAPSGEVARHIVAQEIAENCFRGFAEGWGNNQTVISLVNLWNEGIEKAGFTSYPK